MAINWTAFAGGMFKEVGKGVSNYGVSLRDASMIDIAEARRADREGFERAYREKRDTRNDEFAQEGRDIQQDQFATGVENQQERWRVGDERNARLDANTASAQKQTANYQNASLGLQEENQQMSKDKMDFTESQAIKMDDHRERVLDITKNDKEIARWDRAFTSFSNKQATIYSRAMSDIAEAYRSGELEDLTGEVFDGKKIETAQGIRDHFEQKAKEVSEATLSEQISKFEDGMPRDQTSNGLGGNESARMSNLKDNMMPTLEKALHEKPPQHLNEDEKREWVHDKVFNALEKGYPDVTKDPEAMALLVEEGIRENNSFLSDNFGDKMSRVDTTKKEIRVRKMLDAVLQETTVTGLPPEEVKPTTKPKNNASMILKDGDPVEVDGVAHVVGKRFTQGGKTYMLNRDGEIVEVN